MMTAATLEHTTATAQGREVSFRDTLASEWIKLKTLRSTYITLGLGFSLSVAMTPPCTSPRALARVQALALDLVLELEADERARQRRAVPARRRRTRSGIRRAA